MCRDPCLGPAVLILIKSWKLSHLCLSICWIVYEKYLNWSATRFYITCINRIWLSHAIQRPCILNIIHISYGFCFQIAVWQHQCNGSYKDFNVFFISNLYKSNMASTIYLRIIMKTVVGKCIWRFPYWKIEDPSIQINITCTYHNTLQNMACHTGIHYQDNYSVALSLLKKLQFVWRLDTRWFYPQVPDIQMGWGDLTIWEYCSVAILMAHWSHNPLGSRRTDLRLRVQ